MYTVKIQMDYARVLQEIRANGWDDVLSLSDSLGIERGRVTAIVASLRRCGLVTISRTAQDGLIFLSPEGYRGLNALNTLSMSG